VGVVDGKVAGKGFLNPLRVVERVIEHHEAEVVRLAFDCFMHLFGSLSQFTLSSQGCLLAR
jgi:class 3 adenylate cyclase